MNKYIYQKFLLQCDYDTVDLGSVSGFEENIDDIQLVGTAYNLFDLGKEYTRKIRLNDLDVRIDTLEDWECFVCDIQELEALLIYDDVPYSKNKAIAEYRIATLKAYVYRIQNDCKGVKLYYHHTA